MKENSISKDNIYYTTLEVDEERYVSETFKGDSQFKYIRGMIYEKFEAILTQAKGKESKEIFKVDVNYSGLDEESVSCSFPIPYRDYLLYIGLEEDEKEDDVHKRRLLGLLMPAYNSPVSPQISETTASYLKY